MEKNLNKLESEGTKNNLEPLDDSKIAKLNGGSLEHSGDGFRVYNSVTGENFGTYDYGKAVEVAKENKVSAMGTWGDNEVPCGLIGTGLTCKDIRVNEDKTHKANPIYGTGSFKK